MSITAVLDYGSSNLRSVTKALEHVADSDNKIIVSSEAEQIHKADHVVFPGQGAIGQCMQSIKAKGLDEVLAECLVNKPFLGICMGMQTLMDESEEDEGTSGLGIIKGKVFRFPDKMKDEKGDICKVPHMGWNRVYPKIKHPLWKGIKPGERFYFVHSYYVQAENENEIAATTDYILDFNSAIARDNLFAVQFHPEKSQQSGLQLLSNFLNW